MGKATDIAIAFCTGLAAGSLIWLLAALLSACASNTRNIPADERIVFELNSQIDRLTRQKVAVLKAIQERKERDKAEKAR